MFTGDFQGSKTIMGGNQVVATQGFNINHANKLEQLGGGSAGNSAAHEILEGWYAGTNFPAQNWQGNNIAPYLPSHKFALSKTYDNSNIIPNINPITGRASYINSKTGNSIKLYDIPRSILKRIKR